MGGSGDPILVRLIVDGADLLGVGRLEESVVLVWPWLARDSGAGFGMRFVADLTPILSLRVTQIGSGCGCLDAACTCSWGRVWNETCC